MKRCSCTCLLQPFETPERLAGILNYGQRITWNCSVPHWPRFQRHFRCNMRQECANEEDETECPYSSCEHGGVRIHHACYFYVVNNVGMTLIEGKRECRFKRAQLASLSSLAKWNGVMTWLHWRNQWRDPFGEKFMFVGLKSAPQGLPFMYVDDTFSAQLHQATFNTCAPRDTNVTLHHAMSRNLPDGHFHVFIFSENKFYAIYNGENQRTSGTEFGTFGKTCSKC